MDAPKPKPPTPKMLTTNEILAQARILWRKTRQPTIALATIALFLPQYLGTVVFDFWGLQQAAALRDMTAMLAQNGGSFLELQSLAMSFFGQFVLAMLALWYIFLAGYYGIIYVCVETERGHNLPPWGDIVRLSVRTSLRTGLILACFLFAVALMTQYALFFGIVITVLGLMAPVLIMTDTPNTLQACKRAILLRYTNDSAYTGMGVFFVLLTVGSFVYLGLWGLPLLSASISVMDEWANLSAGFWNVAITGSMTLVYAGLALVENLAVAALIAFLPAITTAIYFTVVRTPAERFNAEA